MDILIPLLTCILNPLTKIILIVGGGDTMQYKDYTMVRDAAWRLLIDCNVIKLPIKITDILQSLNIEIHKYNDNESFISQNNLKELSLTTDGFCLLLHSQPHIFYNGTKSVERMRFTLAHELGHILLGHISDKPTNRNIEPIDGDNYIEQEANIMASRILAPACVLWGLDVQTPQQIASLCNISLESAKWRHKRLMQLYKRNKFLTSPLEQQVYNQFLEYIKNHRLT